MFKEGKHWVPVEISNLAVTELEKRIATLEARNAALAAENERLRKAGEWQPINTAPKDGTDILIRVIMRWDKDAKGWAYFQNPATNAEWMPLVNAAKEGRDAK